MAKLFRLSCSIESYLRQDDERPEPPGWLKKDELESTHSWQYWWKLYWATPPWINWEMIQQMRQIYTSAKPGEHVDHIVPLKSPYVCGLHVPWNLQVIPAKQNLSKSNQWWPGHPCENHDMFPNQPEPHQCQLL